MRNVISILTCAVQSAPLASSIFRTIMIIIYRALRLHQVIKKEQFIMVQQQKRKIWPVTGIRNAFIIIIFQSNCAVSAIVVVPSIHTNRAETRIASTGRGEHRKQYECQLFLSIQNIYYFTIISFFCSLTFNRCFCFSVVMTLLNVYTKKCFVFFLLFFYLVCLCFLKPTPCGMFRCNAIVHDSWKI